MYGTLKDTGLIWFDGKMVPWDQAKVHVLTHTMHYGTAVFEGLRAYPEKKGPAIFRLDDHNKRLFNSAHITRMRIPYTEKELSEAQCAVVRENKLESAYIRPLVFYGDEQLGLRTSELSVHVIVAAWKWGDYIGEGVLENGVRVKTSSFTRHHVNATFCKAKMSSNYMNSIMALREALDDGYQETLLLDAQGYVAEGSSENVFYIANKKIYTPMLTSCLPGITRDTVITLARELGYSVEEKLITRDDFYIADEAFFTGSAAEVTPIKELDNRRIGNGARGPITTQLQHAYFDVVHGRNEKYKEWLTTV